MSRLKLISIAVLVSLTSWTSVFAASAPPVDYRMVAAQFPARDQVVAAYTDRDWSLDRTGHTDSSANIQLALNAIGAAGGGTLFLSSGVYRLDNPLIAPPGVTIRGEIAATGDPYRYKGTVLAAYAGKGDANAPPLIKLSTDSGIRDCIIWYPDQDPNNIAVYPPSVDHTNASTSVDNVVFVNSYQAYRSGYNMSGRAYVRDIRGTPLSIGIEIDGLADTGRVEDVDFAPQYWAHSGLPGSPTSTVGPYSQFMLSQGVGIMERRIDWTNTADINIDGYNKAYYATYSLNTEDLGKGHLTVSPNGENFNYNIRNCNYGVYMDSISNSGMIFTRFHIQAAKAAFYVGQQCTTTVTLLDSALASAGNVVEEYGTGRLLVRDCTFESGAFATSGELDCVASKFAGTSCDIGAADTLTNASFFGDTFETRPTISGSDNAKANVHIVDVPVAPRIEYQADAIDFQSPRGAERSALFVVTKDPYRALADGKTDCSSSVRAAIKAASAAGGGIVFFPPGAYVISTPLTLPTGVELRGIFDGPHDAGTIGSSILVETGQGNANGPAFLSMERGSTVRGLNFHYPGQQMAEITDFPFLLRGMGSDVTIDDVASANVSRFVDLMTNRCDNAYVDHLEGQPIALGIEVGGGSTNVSVSDCQFNPSNWTFANIFNAPKVEYPDPAARSLIEKGYITGLQTKGVVYVLGDCVGLKFYRDFVFAGRYGLRCIAQNGRGPSGTCLELGVDGSTTALRIDAIGPGGFPFINSQLVVTSELTGERHAVELGNTFTGIARVYGLNEWGGRTDSACQVLGGTLRVDGAHFRNPGNPAWDVHGGALTVSASCVREDAPLLPSLAPTGSNIRVNGNILPETAGDETCVAAGSNMIYTDAGAKRPASLPPTN